MSFVSNVLKSLSKCETTQERCWFLGECEGMIDLPRPERQPLHVHWEGCTVSE